VPRVNNERLTIQSNLHESDEKQETRMQSIIHLPPRRYTVLDSLSIAFRCAPVAAFFYGFFDIAWAALTPVATLVAAQLIDAVVRTVSNAEPVQNIYAQLMLLAGITAFGWLRSSMHNIADLRLVLALRARYRTALTEKRTRLAYRLLEQSNTWDLIQRVAANPEGGRLKATYYHLVDMAAFIIKVVGLLAILASAIWWAPLIVIAVVGFALATGVRGGKTIYRAEQEAAEHDRRVGYLGEVMLGRDAAAERTLFGSGGLVAGMWHQVFRTALRIRFRARIKWYLNAYAGNVTNLLIWLTLMLLLLMPLQAGTVSIGLFIALTQAFTRFDIVWGFMDTVHGLAADAEFFKDLTTFLALEEQVGACIAPSTIDRKPNAVAAGIPSTLVPSPALLELRNVCFRYPGTERRILDGLNLVFEPGKHYALVGANGCGKTTVTRLVTGLYPAESGSILLNGREIGEYSQSELHVLFSIIYQDFARYGVSLHDNVFLGYECTNNDNVADRNNAAGQVFDKVGLSPLIDRLPMGADTPLGKYVPDGIDISGGEWQRVAMARSLARPSALRILDEPTAALDPVAESELYANFERLTEGATTLLITHRLGATKTADVIMVLDEGRIVESGSHAELMRGNALYCRMYESQRYWYEAH
jgi:ATP-binding cassette subfamily B protein